MQLRRSLLALMGALSLAAAHFEVTHPPARTSGSHDAISFPCGGQTVSANRFAVPLDNPQLSLGMTMGHDQAALQVLLGLGNDPGSNFNISVLPLMRQVGLGDLCLPNVRLSETVLGVAPTDGMNATLQVVTNGDPSGGLYNCVDITFSAAAQFSKPDSCTNGTVTAEFFTGEAAGRNANETTPDGSPQPGSGGGSGGGGGGQGQPGASTSLVVSWGLLGGAVAGAIALL